MWQHHRAGSSRNVGCTSVGLLCITWPLTALARVEHRYLRRRIRKQSWTAAAATAATASPRRAELRAGRVSCLHHHRDVICWANLWRRTSQDLAANPLGARVHRERVQASAFLQRDQRDRLHAGQVPRGTRLCVLPQVWRRGYREPSERHVIVRAEGHQPHSVPASCIAR